MAELADAPDLGSGAARRAGSTPVIRILVWRSIMIPYSFLNRIILLTDIGPDEDVRIPFLEGIINYFASGKFLRTLVVIAIGVGIWILIRFVSKRQLEKAGKGSIIERNAHFLLMFIRVILTFMLLIIVLQVNGINVSSLVAGLGIVSVIVGFAFQDLLADWINGITIATERFFNVGDVITVGDVTGRVVKINLKITQIEDIDTGSIVTMDNRLVSQAKRLNGNINLLVPMPYDLPLNETNEMLDDIVGEVKDLDGVKWCECRGIKAFEDSRISYFMRIVCDDPFKRLAIMRYANDIIRLKYEERGIDIPYNQLDVHIKEQ